MDNWWKATESSSMKATESSSPCGGFTWGVLFRWLFKGEKIYDK